MSRPLLLRTLQHYVDCYWKIRQYNTIEGGYVTLQAVMAVAQIESGFREEVVSSDGRGSVGLMQVLPATARDMGVLGPQSDPYCSFEAGIRYLNWCTLVLRQHKCLDETWIEAYNVGAWGYVAKGRRNPRYSEKWVAAKKRWAALSPLGPDPYSAAAVAHLRKHYPGLQ